MGDPGRPALPTDRIRLLLPPDANPKSVKVTMENIQVQDLPDTWDVAPIPPVAVSAGGTPVWPPNRKIEKGRDVKAYAADLFAPAFEPLRVVADIMRYWCIAEVTYPLYSYNPVTRKLRKLESATVVVTYDRQPLPSQKGLPISPLSRAIREKIRTSVVNFDGMAPLYEKSETGTSDPAPGISRYVIITRSAIQSGSSQLANFVASKQAQGFTVQVVTEGTWGGGTGNTAAENIRAWLAANYVSLSIDYVLLIGNPHPVSGDVPMKMCYPQRYDIMYEECPTDFYFAELTGDWDLDNDNKCGEYLDDYGAGGASRNFDVIAGRIPYYGSLTDLDSILSKLVTYAGASSGSIAWRRRALLPMKPSDASTPGYNLGEAIKNNILVPKGGWNYHRVYEQNYGLSPVPESTPCTVAKTTAAWLSANTGVTFWWTHGSSTSAADIMDLSGVATLDNSHPAFTFQCSCLNAYPEVSNNLAYSILKRGGIAAISGSRVTWYWPGQTTFNDLSSNASMEYEYAERLIGSDMNCGEALHDLKYDITPDSDVMWMNYLGFNVYGCPAIGLLTATGGSLPAPVLNAEPNLSPERANTVYWQAVVAGADGAINTDPEGCPSTALKGRVNKVETTRLSADVAGIVTKAIRPREPVVPKPDGKKGGAILGRIEPSATSIFSETFEGVFPGSSWTLYGTPTWNDTSYDKYGGSWSGWCAGSSVSPANGYPDNMDSWMVYGPFSLSDASGARLAFWYKNYSESDWDYFKWMASVDGNQFYGYQVSGDQNSWRSQTFDLAAVPTLGNLCGRTQVWIAFQFTSDGSISGPSYTGAYVDDVVIEKDVSSQADLTPYLPTNWNSKIPVGIAQLSGTSAHSYSGAYYSNQVLYLNWASLNQGGATASGYKVHVEVTGTGGGTWDWTGLTTAPNYWTHLTTDQAIGPLSAGTHTLKVWVDYNGTVGESSEENNYCERTITVSVPGNVEYYAECDDNAAFSSPVNSGWILGTQYTFSGLFSRVKYFYRVKARKGADTSGWSNVESSMQLFFYHDRARKGANANGGSNNKRSMQK
ncbi:MAG: C25 family cysteine peptidase [Pontiellaceae bacterium]|nr:C25 family cysteine peptidase [Pontiellaceae bacterium]